MARKQTDFQTIRSEGGLLPPDLLHRVIEPREKLRGTRPEDYNYSAGERLNEVITQSWNRLRRHWIEFRTVGRLVPEGDPATGITNDKWNLPLLRELGFGLLPTAAAPEIGGRTYAISRFSGPLPIHLIGCGLSLDRRAAGVRGAATVNPHGMVQEFLNRSPGHLWAILSNGFTFRILRDNQALSRQSYLEFDLQAMFDGEVYADFVTFWLMAHATRFAPREGDRPESCWLEEWTKVAVEEGTRALGELRGGVERALQTLGEGLTSHPRNTALREALRSGVITPAGLHGQLLRVVYRLIFLFVAEDRKLDGLSVLHSRDDSESAHIARERYALHYSTGRLREMASRIKGSRHGDLWEQFCLVVGALSGEPRFESVRHHLALPVLGSFLWNPNSTREINALSLSAENTPSCLTNHDFLEVLRNLAFTRQGKVLRAVNYKDLGAEELGGVYESLLALTPQIAGDGARFTFAEFAGNARKTSGSYYTPDSLVQCLLDSALDPVVEEAIKGKAGAEAEQALLRLKVCDPAVGSGHFLVGAAHRLARHLSRVRAYAQGESEPSPLLYQHALRDVIGRCLYGVDINPMSAELCRVSLWLEAMEPGKPLTFLDHHIRVGNSLLGATPELLAAGLPDDAFKPIEGDDKKACAALKKRNASERKGLGPLFAEQDAETLAHLQQAAAALEELPDNRPEEIRAKELAFRNHEQTEEYRQKKLLADAWCAAFVVKKYFPPHSEDARFPSKEPFGITQGHLNDLAAGRDLPEELAKVVGDLAEQYQFFHWHLALPEVFGRGEANGEGRMANGGFDVVLGNPPWERVKLQEKEWFAERRPDIAQAQSAAIRKRIIKQILLSSDPDEVLLRKQFLSAVRGTEGESHILRCSGAFPLCGRGDVNVYAVFAERMRHLLSSQGLAGVILPTGIATDDTTRLFFEELMSSKALVSLLDFENRDRILFPDVYYRFRFCLLTCSGSRGPKYPLPTFVFFALNVEEARRTERAIVLTAEDIALLNPNTHTCPIFRSPADAELTKATYRRVPIAGPQKSIPETTWGLTFTTMFHMTNDSDLFLSSDYLLSEGWKLKGNVFGREDENCLPLYEGRMIDSFDNRYASTRQKAVKLQRSAESVELTCSDKESPTTLVQPRSWVLESEVTRSLPNPGQGWLLSCMTITSATNARTAVASIVSRSAFGNSLLLVATPKPAVEHGLLLGVFNSMVFDYASKQKVSGNNFNIFIIRQLPLLPVSFGDEKCPWANNGLSRSEWLLLRILELVYTAWDLEPFAQDCGFAGPPFRWDESRRYLLRCELDAAFFHLYLPADANGEWKMAKKEHGCPYDETPQQLAELKKHFPTPRDAVAYVMETFPIVKRRDEEKFGEYRTKRVILEMYDDMQTAVRTGEPYRTRLEPPPADVRCCHPVETRPGWAGGTEMSAAGLPVA